MNVISTKLKTVRGILESCGYALKTKADPWLDQRIPDSVVDFLSREILTKKYGRDIAPLALMLFPRGHVRISLLQIIAELRDYVESVMAHGYSERPSQVMIFYAGSPIPITGEIAINPRRYRFIWGEILRGIERYSHLFAGSFEKTVISSMYLTHHRGKSRHEPFNHFIINLIAGHCQSRQLRELKVILEKFGNGDIDPKSKIILQWMSISTPWMLKYVIFMLLPLRSIHPGTINNLRFLKQNSHQFIEQIRRFLWKLQASHAGFAQVYRFEDRNPNAIFGTVYESLCRWQFSWFHKEGLPQCFKDWLMPASERWFAYSKYFQRSTTAPLEMLVRSIPKAILEAPNTCFELLMKTKMEVADERIMTWLHKFSRRGMWSNHLVLLGAVYLRDRVFNRPIGISTVAKAMEMACQEEGITSVDEWDPDVIFSKIFQKTCCAQMTDSIRVRFWSVYTHATSILHSWLSAQPHFVQEQLKPYVLPKVKNWATRRGIKLVNLRDRQIQKRKERTEHVTEWFPYLMGYIGENFNVIERLHKQMAQVQIAQKEGRLRFPFDLKYQERDGVIHFRIFNAHSLASSPHMAGCSEWSIANYLRRTPPNDLNLEYIGFVTPEGKELPKPWFIELIQHRPWLWKFGRSSKDTEDFILRHGYLKNSFSVGDPLFLKLPKSPPYLGANSHSAIVFPLEPFWLAAHIGRAALALVLRGALRMGEIGQAPAFDPDLCYEIKDFRGVVGRDQLVIKAFVKSPSTRKMARDLYLTPDAAKILAEAVEAIQDRYKRHPEEDPEPERKPEDHLPKVTLNKTNAHHMMCGAHRYLFQIKGRGLCSSTLLACMRYLLHGIIFKKPDGTPFAVANHDFRHAFAEWLRQEMGVPVDIIGRLLNHDSVASTSQYARGSTAKAANRVHQHLLKQVNYLDIPAALKSLPEKARHEFEEHQKKCGVIAGVIGGECGFMGHCRWQSRCLGCIHHIPSPEKRAEVMHEIVRIESEISYHAKLFHGIQVARLQEDLARAQKTLKIIDFLAELERDRQSPNGLPGLDRFHEDNG